MDHMRDGTLPDHSVVEAQVRIDLPAVPQHGHVQHHPVLRLKVPLLQPAQLVQLSGLQLCDEAKPSHIDSKNRNFIEGHQLCKM